MRDIRFRAWDKINKRWLNLWKLLFSSTGEVFAAQELDGEQYGLHQIDLVQSTGLKDKTGREIHEGDIVQSRQDFGVDEFSDIRDLIEVVEYLGGAFYPICNMPTENYEVIGNIYENPELVK